MVTIPEAYWRACGQDLWLVGVDSLHVLFLAEIADSEVGTLIPCLPFLLNQKQIVKKTLGCYKYMV